MADGNIKPLYVPNVPRELLNDFQKTCIDNRESMCKRVIKLIEGYVKEIQDPVSIK